MIRTLMKAPSSTRPLVSPEKKRKKRRERRGRRPWRSLCSCPASEAAVWGAVDAGSVPHSPVAAGVGVLGPALPAGAPARDLPSPSYAPTLAVFKPKTKAAPKKVEKPNPKLKVEDGIFGTSGGIGFTKANELFVGRVAMIGFAGILSQLNLETGIPIYEAEPLLLFFILFTLLGAIGALGDRGRFVDDPPTGLEKAVIPPGKGIRTALGLKEGGPLFGFTKANELFVGRLAQLGIAFSIIGEIITGKGALAQLNIETGVPISDIEPLVLLNVAFFFVAALNPGTGKFLTDEEE
ncbi:unnamed protein product [Spirodela intermedia]|uniref:Uncharacterized protein n=1 Tax=Spirodela intermedia TaxID=51605 RepID=A0A7I8JC34_SPIIN|nr:unnamed protein product [Spirodela intermedia]CAA6667684.1 unnamed protein product [Spirodela intermedia]